MTGEKTKVRIGRQGTFLFVPFLVLLIVIVCGMSTAYASDNGIPEGYEPPLYNGIPAQQFKDVFEEETVTVEGIEVKRDHYNFGDNAEITFRIFNSTTQETECMVQTESPDGGFTLELPPLQLRKNHNYIFFCEDENYQRGTSVYVHIMDSDDPYATEGPGAYDYKIYDAAHDTYHYEYLETINVFKRDSACADPYDYNRFSLRDGNGDKGLPVIYDGQLMSGISFRLVSNLETVEAVSAEDGRLYADIIEDVTYLVYVDDSDYYIDPFPLVCKDKTEYKEGRFCYDHSSCNRVDELDLIRIGDAPPSNFHRVEKLTSLKGNATVSGINFKHLLLLDRKLDPSVAPDMGDAEYEVVGLTAVNPHRWEICKLKGTDFTYTVNTPEGKYPESVGCIKDGSVQALEYTVPDAGLVSFRMDSISLYPVVIEYSDIVETTPTVKIKSSSYTYTGKNIRPTVTVTADGRKLAADEYTVTYPSASKAVGPYKVRVDLKGRYSGSASVSYSVVPKGTTISSVAKEYKKATVKWKKQSVQTTGYQILYSTSKSFKKGNKTVTVKSVKTVKKTIKKLKSKKTYYFKIRTYRKVGKKNYYSAWSKMKSVRVK